MIVWKIWEIRIYQETSRSWSVTPVLVHLQLARCLLQKFQIRNGRKRRHSRSENIQKRQKILLHQFYFLPAFKVNVSNPGTSSQDQRITHIYLNHDTCLVLTQRHKYGSHRDEQIHLENEIVNHRSAAKHIILQCAFIRVIWRARVTRHCSHDEEIRNCFQRRIFLYGGEYLTDNIFVMPQ